MARKSNLDTAHKQIKPLNMNGLSGRMLYLPAPKNKKRHILLLYGHHASIERMYGIAETLNTYGSVTMPDFPGFGGMDSFYKIGMKPTIDTMADYLASFVKLRFRGKKITIAGMSLGFAIATRMLQRYPELVKKVDLLISMVGLTHYQDIIFSKPRVLMYKTLSEVFSFRLTAALFHSIILSPIMIRTAYAKTYNARNKLEHLSEEERKRAVEFEIKLWRSEDTRTYMRMTLAMLRLDNCTKQINLPVEHVSIENDQYFDHPTVEQHMRIIFNDFNEHVAVLPHHAPSVIADKKEAKPFVPSSIKKVLRKNPA